MARPRKPKGAKVIKGTFRKCRENPNEPDPMPLDELPEPPDDLPELGKEEWRRVIKFLVDNKIVGAEGLGFLETYCRLHTLIKQERDLLRIPASYISQYQAAATRLCLTPDGRAKFKLGDKPEHKSNPFEAFK